MNTATTVEREIKLRFESAEQARAAIKSTGATPLLGRRLQEDSLLDTSDVNHALLLPILLHCRDDQGRPLLGPPRRGRETSTAERKF